MKTKDIENECFRCTKNVQHLAPHNIIRYEDTLLIVCLRRKSIHGQRLTVMDAEKRTFGELTLANDTKVEVFSSKPIRHAHNRS